MANVYMYTGGGTVYLHVSTTFANAKRPCFSPLDLVEVPDPPAQTCAHKTIRFIFTKYTAVVHGYELFVVWLLLFVHSNNNVDVY